MERRTCLVAIPASSEWVNHATGFGCMRFATRRIVPLTIDRFRENLCQASRDLISYLFVPHPEFNMPTPHRILHPQGWGYVYDSSTPIIFILGIIDTNQNLEKK